MVSYMIKVWSIWLENHIFSQIWLNTVTLEFWIIASKSSQKQDPVGTNGVHGPISIAALLLFI